MINILHGTDWWTDCDDIAALRVLCRAHKAGRIKLCCVGINAVMEYSAPSVSAFLVNEGVDAPIGVDVISANMIDVLREGGLNIVGAPAIIGVDAHTPDTYRYAEYGKVLDFAKKLGIKPLKRVDFPHFE